MDNTIDNVIWCVLTLNEVRPVLINSHKQQGINHTKYSNSNSDKHKAKYKVLTFKCKEKTLPICVCLGNALLVYAIKNVFILFLCFVYCWVVC